MTDPHLAEVIGERRQLINLAYRLLGSLAEAEDVAQETYTPWYALTEQQREAIDSPGAWVTRRAGCPEPRKRLARQRPARELEGAPGGRGVKRAGDSRQEGKYSE